MKFASNLKRLREEKGLTMAELGKAIGKGTTTIADMESGARLPKIDTAKTLANYFDVSVDYLVGETSVRNYQVEAAHRYDDPITPLPEEARKSIEEYKEFILKKYGVKYD